MRARYIPWSFSVCACFAQVCDLATPLEWPTLFSVPYNQWNWHLYDDDLILQKRGWDYFLGSTFSIPRDAGITGNSGCDGDARSYREAPAMDAS
jgi:hypothetical protein